MNLNRYFVELIQNGNSFKLAKAKKLVGVNQHTRTWEKTNSRSLARKLNKSNLVIK
jgi:hypothetical protein